MAPDDCSLSSLTAIAHSLPLYSSIGASTNLSFHSSSSTQPMSPHVCSQLLQYPLYDELLDVQKQAWEWLELLWSGELQNLSSSLFFNQNNEAMLTV
jgi:hypothetical protein